MDAAELERTLRAHRIVPVVTIETADDAPRLGAALATGGLPLAEITFRTPAAADAIRAMRATCPHVLVGAGTVLDPATAEQAVRAGAQFLVAPGVNPAVVARAADLGVPMIPGVSTATEIDMALAHGLRLLKFFPAEAAGGLAVLSALAGPYQGVSFMPTGGISPANVAKYLGRSFVAACGGSWLAPTDAIAAERFDLIAETVRTAVELCTHALTPTPVDRAQDAARTR